jgi:enolase
MTSIDQLHAREILDSRGTPTIEVEIRLQNGIVAVAAVPSGASTGTKEAVELRDGDPKRFFGKGVTRAVSNVNDIIGPALKGADIADQKRIDARLIELDGTPGKSKLGANAVLGVSLVAARAAALLAGKPLYAHISDAESTLLPVPMFNIFNGGAHADNTVDIQEFMLVPAGARTFAEAYRCGAEVYHALKSVLKKRRLGTTIGDEGGFAPNVRTTAEAFETILEAIATVGLTPGKDVALAIDAAASEFQNDQGSYTFAKSDKSVRTASQLIDLYAEWVRQYPIWMIEDGLAEDDWIGWKELTQRLGSQVQLVGDDIFVTNTGLIGRGIAEGIANAVLIKPNQIGTVTETLAAISLSRQAGYGLVISHRSGETWDDFIADLAVATSAGQIKTGAPCRGERVAKYNRLLRIEVELGSRARFAGRRPFSKASAAADR